MFKLAEESLKMQFWRNNGKCYLIANDNKGTCFAVGKSKIDVDIEVIIFTKDMPYILDLTLYIYIYIYTYRDR